MNKKLIRLTESDLHRIVAESVKRVLNEDALEDLRLSDETSTGKKRKPKLITHGTAEIPKNWFEKGDDAFLKRKKKWDEKRAKEKAKMEKIKKGFNLS